MSCLYYYRDFEDNIFKLSQQCCYNVNGSLIIGGSRAGSVDAQPPHDWENHFHYDLDSYISCCKSSSSTPENIQRYYEKRPSDDCSTFRLLDPPG